MEMQQTRKHYRRSTDKRPAPTGGMTPGDVLAAARAGAAVLRETQDLDAAIAAVKQYRPALELAA